MVQIGRLGIGTRGAERPGFWDGDRLYDLQAHPGDMKNLAANPEYTAEVQNMKALLTREVQAGARPFGEFVPGGNAAPGGQIERQIAEVKTLTIKGKTVIVPDNGQTQEIPTRLREARQSRRMNRKPNL
jgi:hypothetical protein